ncbi:MAG: MFS transporter [Candidatus Nezhaarchaeota archaeon]|nr:MFS transporter [Candidatus Nezhaarchaeota archaeon]
MTLPSLIAVKAKYAALIASGLSSFLTPFIASAINVALPSIGREFRVDAVTLGWIVSSYLLVAGMLSLSFGRLSDIRGWRRIFIVGLLISTTASILSSMSPTAYFLIAFRVVQGVGGAMMFATSMAILTSIFPPNERGKAIGINTGMVYVGATAGPSLGGFITQNLGWRVLFLVTGAISLVSLIVALLYLSGDWAEAVDEKFDYKGSVLYGFMFFSLIYGLSESIHFFILLGVTLLALLIFLEARVESPVFPVHLFLRNQLFLFSSIAALINYAAIFASGYLMSLYLQLIKGLDSQAAGVILLFQPVVMAISAPIAGWLSDRIEPRVVASVGMAVTTLSLALLSSISEATDVNNIIVYLVLMGLGIGLFSSPNTNAMMSSVDRRFFGVASATVATMRVIGQTLSMAIAMLIASIVVGRVEITMEVYVKFIESLNLTFKVSAILCFIGIFMSLGRGRLRRSESTRLALNCGSRSRFNLNNHAST